MWFDERIVNIILLFGVLAHGFMYYAGIITYDGYREIQRRERVKKCGYLFLLVMIIGVLIGISEIIDLLSDKMKVFFLL